MKIFIMNILDRPLIDFNKIHLKKGQSGQALLEALFTMSLSIPLATLILTLAYFVYLKNQVEFIGYEALVCRISWEPRNKSFCDLSLKRKLIKVLPFGEIREIKFIRNGDQEKIRMVFRLSPFNIGKKFQWTFQKSIDRRLS